MATKFENGESDDESKCCCCKLFSWKRKKVLINNKNEKEVKEAEEYACEGFENEASVIDISNETVTYLNPNFDKEDDVNNKNIQIDVLEDNVFANNQRQVCNDFADGHCVVNDHFLDFTSTDHSDTSHSKICDMETQL